MLGAKLLVAHLRLEALTAGAKSDSTSHHITSLKFRIVELENLLELRGRQLGALVNEERARGRSSHSASPAGHSALLSATTDSISAGDYLSALYLPRSPSISHHLLSACISAGDYLSALTSISL